MVHRPDGAKQESTEGTSRKGRPGLARGASKQPKTLPSRKGHAPQGARNGFSTHRAFNHCRGAKVQGVSEGAIPRLVSTSANDLEWNQPISLVDTGLSPGVPDPCAATMPDFVAWCGRLRAPCAPRGIPCGLRGCFVFFREGGVNAETTATKRESLTRPTARRRC